MTPDGERLAVSVREVLGSPDTWRPMPSGYPDSLALCVLDAIWSIGVRYEAVKNVVSRYRECRRAEGGNADRDGASDLLQHVRLAGGPDRFADRLRNQQRVSTRPGAVRKAEAVYQAAEALSEAGIETVKDLRTVATGPDEARVKRAWLALPGQRSGVSWHYLLMLARLPGVKPDRMICRFVARALGRDRIAPAEAVTLVMQAAERLDVSPTALDHEIWRYERPVRRGRVTPGPVA
ncbi:hypothetical protein [Micromonospora sp. KC213]|uniref:hypothetical protein n=1 Tax=Micromonospora sp. KC213 TaxID=2530378 RepID=UPI001045DB7E|nr:hypothetical protein [Micromonospora sp. KC213]TDC41406.1 hypothetical protein E1166_11830 [Micromonospora sp. KC213]